MFVHWPVVGEVWLKITHGAFELPSKQPVKGFTWPFPDAFFSKRCAEAGSTASAVKTSSTDKRKMDFIGAPQHAGKLAWDEKIHLLGRSCPANFEVGNNSRVLRDIEPTCTIASISPLAARKALERGSLKESRGASCVA